MGLLRAAVNRVREFFGQEPVVDAAAEIAAGSVVDAKDWGYQIDGSNKEDWERQIYKKSSAPAVLVSVGFGPEYNKQLANRKRKSQQRNWKKWKRRGF